MEERCSCTFLCCKRILILFLLASMTAIPSSVSVQAQGFPNGSTTYQPVGFSAAAQQ